MSYLWDACFGMFPLFRMLVFVRFLLFDDVSEQSSFFAVCSCIVVLLYVRTVGGQDCDVCGLALLLCTARIPIGSPLLRLGRDGRGNDLCSLAMFVACRFVASGPLCRMLSRICYARGLSVLSLVTSRRYICVW